MVYRTSAAEPPRVLEIFATPRAVSIFILFVGSVVGLLGAVVCVMYVLGCITGTNSGDGLWEIFVVAIAFVLAGGFTVRLGLRDFETRVQFSATEQTVTIRWRRRGQVVRERQFDIADIVDVGIETTSSSDSLVYKLVVGTKADDVPLSETAGSWFGPYVRRQNAICEFLHVKARPS